MKEPTRLRETDELPLALRDAFRALEQATPSADTVARVQRALQTLPAAPHPTAANGLGATSKLIVVATVVVGAVTLGLLRSPPSEPPPAQPAAEPSAEPAGPALSAAPKNVPSGASSGVSAGAQVSEPAASPRREAAMDREQLAAASASAQRESADPARRAQRRAAAVSGRKAPSASGSRAASGPAAADRSADTSPVATAQENLDVPAPSGPAASRAVTQLDRGDQTRPSEALLLAQAKRLAASDPQAALRRVESLAFHYPEGAFIQERELLEIQLHERLGHQQTAEQLIQRFRARHPASVYRRALAP